MEAISPYMEIATSYIATPYGVAALAGVILVSVLLLVFSTQKEITYEDYSKQMSQPQPPKAAPKKQKKTVRKRTKKAKEVVEQETVEEDEVQYDIVAVEEVPLPEDIPAGVTEPQDAPKAKKLKPKKKKAKKEVVKEEIVEEVVPEEKVEETLSEEVEEAAAPAVEPAAAPAAEPEESPVEEEDSGPAVEPELIEEAMEPAPVVETATPPPAPVVEEVVIVKAAAPVVAAAPAKVKKSKKKGNTSIADPGTAEGLFQIVDQANLSETDIETLLAILRSKEGDDNWTTGRPASAETKDSLRKKVQIAESTIGDLEQTIAVLKKDMIDNGDDKVKLTAEIRALEKRHQKEREALSTQLAHLTNVTQTRLEEVNRLKKDIDDRDRINNNLQMQLSQQRANPTVNPNIDLKNRVVELEGEAASPRKKLNSAEGLIAQICQLQEELQESKEQYHDLERNLSQVNTMEKKLIDKDDIIMKQKESIAKLEVDLKNLSSNDSALVEAQSQTVALKAELEKLQECVSEHDTTRTALDTLRVEHDALLSEMTLHKDTQMSKELAAAAAAELETEVVAKSADDGEAAAAQQAKIDQLTAEVKACKERIEELEKAPSESSMSSTVDISAEIAEQLQVAESQLQAVREEQESVKAELAAATAEKEAQAAELAALRDAHAAELETLREAHTNEVAALRDVPTPAAPAAEEDDVAVLVENTEELDKLRSDLETVRQECAAHANEVTRLQEELSQAQSVPESTDSEAKLIAAAKERDQALADAKRYQEGLDKTEEILRQLQSKFESNIQSWAKDLEDKRVDLEAERERAEDLERKLSAASASEEALSELTSEVETLKTRLNETEESLTSEKRWHSETLLKLNEMEKATATQSVASGEDVETLQKANDLEQQWHAQTLTQLQQVSKALEDTKRALADESAKHEIIDRMLEEANSDVSLLQDKLATKNLEIASLATQRDQLAEELEQVKSTDDLQQEVGDLKGQSEESQIAEANQSAEKKFTAI